MSSKFFISVNLSAQFLDSQNYLLLNLNMRESEGEGYISAAHSFDQETFQPVQEAQHFQPPLLLQIMIAYLYFIQGLVLSIGVTVPYISQTLPSYETLSFFTLMALPFSLKFLTAPILEKYFNIDYGKRKTWINISQIAISVMLIICSFYAAHSQTNTFAILTLILVFATSLHNTSLIGLCLKELKSPKLMSVIQTIFLSGGGSIGSLVIVKLTSESFARSIGRQAPIMSLRAVLIIFCFVTLVPTVFIHFFFQQTYLEDELKAKKKSLLKVYSFYRVYLQPSTRYFRIFVFLAFYSQGYNFFSAGYSYELIKQGFSKDNLNTINNGSALVQTVIIFFFGAYANYCGFTDSILLNKCLALFTVEVIWIWFPLSLPAVAVCRFLLIFFANWEHLVSTQLCAYFPDSGVSGMLFTMNVSGANFGKLLFLQTALLKVWSWRNLTLFGMILQVVIILFIPKSIELIETGETAVEGLDDDTQKNEQQQQSPTESTK